MKLFDLLKRQTELLRSFRLCRDFTLEDSKINVKTFSFCSHEGFNVYSNDSHIKEDAGIGENYRFYYPVFLPQGIKKFNSAILLLHGLNERNWNKYLSWAEYLVSTTGKPVIMFPIAYHMNRAPSSWANPRDMIKLVSERKKILGDNDKTVTYANVALSMRLHQDPNRFYNSGRQTVIDITDYVKQIKDGENPLFFPDAKIDIMSYSIGSFLSEILLKANPCEMFSDSKLFMFCGGSVFNYMNGRSRSIMDNSSFDRIYYYYSEEWFKNRNNSFEKNNIYDAFTSFIRADKEEYDRKDFLLKNKHRIQGVSLKKDKVIPYSGIEACMGKYLAGETFVNIDFPYEYSHEVPFPVNNKKISSEILSESFLNVFQRAAEFLS